MASPRPSGPALVLGGIRSGKSAFAEALASGAGRPVYYLATGIAVDDDFARRIRRHQESRRPDWTTVEAPYDPSPALEKSLPPSGEGCAVLVDSLDTWVSNLMLERESMAGPELETRFMEKLDSLLEIGRRPSLDMVLVSSEVGMSLVAPTKLGRRFQDLLGLVNQRAAAACPVVYLVAAGIPITIKDER